MILIALIKSGFDFLGNVLLEIYFCIRALTKHFTDETEKYNDLILLFYFLRKRKILFAFQLRIILKVLTQINLASGHTKEDKNKEQLIILTKKSFVEAFKRT